MHVHVIEDGYAIVEGGTWVFVKRGGVSSNTVWWGCWFVCYLMMHLLKWVGGMYVCCVSYCLFFFLNSMSFGFCWLAWSVLLSFPFLNSIIPEVLPQGALSFLRRSLESVWTLCFHCIVYLNTKQRNWAFWVPQEVSDFIQLSEFFMVLHLYSVCVFFSFTLCFEYFLTQS